MTVDFAFKRAPAVRVASIVRIGPFKENNLRAEFGELVRWAERRKQRTGRWIFLERGERRWEACLELKGATKVRGEGKIKVKTLPATSVASVVFNPEEVSPRVVYHGLTDWLRWRRKDGEVKSVGSSREVYSDDPWKNARAWEHADVQFVVRRK